VTELRVCWNDDSGSVSVTLTQIDHVQLAMPVGLEDKAREFYIGILGMTEIAKPPVLAKRGGAWFAVDDVQIHLGVEEDFRAAKKAHVALRLIASAALRDKLSLAGLPVKDDDTIPGKKRFYTEDCFGNRLEFICQD
jgi:catechol 2,3-dioxygenase-like lactoylglutathione lyase family enzyme